MKSEEGDFMEYALLVLYNGFQKIFNLLMQIDIAPGVTVGGLILSVIIISIIFTSFGFMSSLGRSGSHTKYDSAAEKE